MTMPAPIRSRIFVVGCPRSGTTLVQSLLAAHPRLASFPESHFFSAILPLTPPKADEPLRAFLAGAGLPPPSAPPATTTAKRVRQFIGILDRAAADRGYDGWVEKTPIHLHHIDTITRHLPDARFVHVLRAGAPTISSLYRATHEHPEHWDGARSWRQCGERWIGDVVLSLARHGDDGHHLLRYEDLIAAPEAVLQDVCAFVGVDYAPAMLRDHAEVAGELVLGHERWKRRALRPLAAEPDGPTPFEQSARDRIRARVAEAQRQLDAVLAARGGGSCAS